MGVKPGKVVLGKFSNNETRVGEDRRDRVKCEDVYRRCSWGSKSGIKIFTSFRQVTGANIGQQISYSNAKTI